MFNYFGSKSRIAHHYPVPRHRLIIEPFCGSAAYALRYFDHDVWLNDKNPLIVAMWKWLRAARREDIERLQELRPGEDLRDSKFNWMSEVEKAIVGYCARRCAPEPGNTTSGWAAEALDIRRFKFRALESLEHIRHWQITCMDYRDLPNVEATTFVDAPYQHARMHYPHHYLDYDELACWCQTRRGQVVVCEEMGATWLPFKPLCVQRGNGRRDVVEAIWEGGV